MSEFNRAGLLPQRLLRVPNSGEEVSAQIHGSKIVHYPDGGSLEKKKGVFFKKRYPISETFVISDPIFPNDFGDPHLPPYRSDPRTNEQITIYLLENGRMVIDTVTTITHTDFTMESVMEYEPADPSVSVRREVGRTEFATGRVVLGEPVEIVTSGEKKTFQTAVITTNLRRGVR